MRIHFLAASALVVAACGCKKNPPTVDASQAVPVVRTTLSAASDLGEDGEARPKLTLPAFENSLLGVELPDSTPLDLAVRLGQAKRAGPITPENFAVWKAYEATRLDLELQKRRVVYEQQILQVIDDREHAFLLDAERELRRSGLTLKRHLRSFEDLRQKYRQRLREAQQRHRELAASLANWERRHLNPQPFDPFEGVSIMKDPLDEILSQPQIDALAKEGVKDARTLALTFQRQPDRLAQLLNIDRAEALLMVKRAAEHVSADELKELNDLADRVAEIRPGVEAPERDGGEP